jgi:hypothetical protein
LETGDKMDTKQAFEQLKLLWQQLDLSYQQLGIDEDSAASATTQIEPRSAE